MRMMGGDGLRGLTRPQQWAAVQGGNRFFVEGFCSGGGLALALLAEAKARQPAVMHFVGVVDEAVTDEMNNSEDICFRHVEKNTKKRRSEERKVNSSFLRFFVLKVCSYL
jgi:dienelactone hydrolase